jgi:hypothetical protein
MFKKLLLLALVVLLASPVWASQTTTKIIDNVSLTRAFRVNTHGTSYVGDAERVTYFVTYNPTRTGVTANITAEASLEGVTWGPVYLDYAGVTSPKNILSTTNTYVLSLPKELTLPQIRIGIDVPEPSGYGSTDVARVTVTVVEKK